MSEIDRHLPENRAPAPDDGVEIVDVRRGMFRARGT
ncbi:MAG: hypothetical protein QOH80_1103, partial [Actinomycetota bacterium]|nr:hypothetical protein [Actinomycetota bacterium]